MKVKANRNIIYKLEIYNSGTEFEMDDVSAQVQATRGNVEIIGGGVAAAEPELNFVGGGLPSLDEEAAAKRKKK